MVWFQRTSYARGAPPAAGFQAITAPAHVMPSRLSGGFGVVIGTTGQIPLSGAFGPSFQSIVASAYVPMATFTSVSQDLTGGHYAVSSHAGGFGMHVGQVNAMPSRMYGGVGLRMTERTMMPAEHAGGISVDVHELALLPHRRFVAEDRSWPSQPWPSATWDNFFIGTDLFLVEIEQ